MTCASCTLTRLVQYAGLLVGLAGSLGAQATLNLSGPATARRGTTIAVNVSVASPGLNLAALQWDVTVPTGVTVTGIAVGPVASTANKSVSCNAAFTRCLLYGINTNAILAGTVAVMQVKIGSAVALGTVSLGPLTGVAATINGSDLPVTAGPAFSVGVQCSTDFNGDGKTDILDLQLIINEIIANASATLACPNYEVSGDSKCNVVDAQVVVVNAFSGGCP